MIYEEYTASVGSEIISKELNNMSTKAWYKSKTVMFNIVVFLVAFLAIPEFVQLVPPSWMQYVTLGGVVGNLVLRLFFTDSGLTLKEE